MNLSPYKIELDMDTNYIVSGLERSGTSLMMQILDAGGLPVAYDYLRKPDEHNQRGYYELSGGEIIDKLKDGTFPIKDYTREFIKITSWGLKFLPKGKYEIIYMRRNISEIVDSTIKMSGKKYNREDMEKCLIDFEMICLRDLNKLGKFRIISYNNLVSGDDKTVEEELGIIKSAYPEFNLKKAKSVIDEKLYRSRRME
jgi:hypothetical protein